ncbi:MAG: tyrosine protein phosphatase [Hyphomicrobiales bacterium]|nr:tyrosine protein phosphatase [Hyphomicrobiales bacterium]MCP5000702.1 tyrosine protein phosphatase [Hyphomicrobiales bacterium]
MPHLVVCSLSRLAETARAQNAEEMITLLSSQDDVELPSGIRRDRHLFLDMNDISIAVEGLRAPEEQHIERLIDFAQDWDRSAPLLIHCWMGISRSTAAAYIIASALNPGAEEMGLALELRRRSRSATPNARMIRLADGLLARKGRMIAAIDHIGRGADAYEGTPFVLPLEH